MSFPKSFLAFVVFCSFLLSTPLTSFAATSHFQSYLKVRSVSPSIQAGYTPQQIRQAYGIASLSQDGSGQTIAIVDAYDAANISADVQKFDSAFNLSPLPDCPTSQTAACLHKVYAENKKPSANSSWAEETSLDVEWAHAIAPKAGILLVEASSDTQESLLKAVDVATKAKATVVSMSWGSPEFTNEKNDDSHFQHAHIFYVASAGDDGSQVNYPATSPYVLSVGGTSLNLNQSGSISSETAWNGSGGGISRYEKRPTFQKFFTLEKTGRAVPDVSYNADPATGYSIASNGSWLEVGGTSAGTPQWAALIALANQGKSQGMHTTLSSNLLYKASAFRDISSGSNGNCGIFCQAAKQYDTVTGLGSPIANRLIPQLQQ